MSDKFHPASPTDLQAVVNATVGAPPATVSLSWVNGAFSNGVQLLRTSAGQASNFAIIVTLAAGVNSYVDTVTFGAGLLAYRVQSLPQANEMFVSPKYAEVSVNIVGIPPARSDGGAASDGSGNTEQGSMRLVNDGTWLGA